MAPAILRCPIMGDFPEGLGVRWATGPFVPLVHVWRAARVEPVGDATQDRWGDVVVVQLSRCHPGHPGRLVVDGQLIAPGSTSAQFTWTGASAQKTSLIYDNGEAFSFQGTWSLFEMVRNAKITHTAGGFRLDYPISTVVAGHTVSTGKTVTFELSGQGADLLAGDGFSGLTCVKPL